MSNGSRGGPAQPPATPPAQPQPGQTTQPTRQQRGILKRIRNYALGLGTGVVLFGAGLASRPFIQKIVENYRGLNSETEFEIDRDGKVSASLTGRHGSKRYGGDVNDVPANTIFEIDNKGKIHIDARDPNNSNGWHYVLRHDTNDITASFKSNEGSGYKGFANSGFTGPDGYKD